MNIVPINYYLLTNFVKQNVGVPVYTWNGNGYTQSHYQQASKLDEYIHWIVGIDVVDGLRPIARCYCVPRGGSPTVPGEQELKCESSSGTATKDKCGWNIFWTGCTGDCLDRVKTTPSN